MNILIINPILYTPPFRGMPVPQADSIRNSLIINYAIGFHRCGHSVKVLASEEYRPRLEEDYEGVEMVYLPNVGKRYLKRWPNGFPVLGGLRKYLKTEGKKFDIVISSEAFTYTSFVATQVLPERLIVWQEMGQHVAMGHYILSKIWYNIFVRLFMQRALFVPRSLRSQKFISKYAKRVSAEPVEHVIDQKCFYPSNDKQPYFVVIARLDIYKNVKTTIAKFADFCRNYDKPYKLYIVGDGYEHENLQKQSTELGISDKVVFCGFKNRTEVSDILRHATAFLTDSMRELNMVSMMEAVSCGTPVISNTVPYPSDTIKEYNLGIVDDNWDFHSLIYVAEHIAEYTPRCVEYGKKLSFDYLVNKMTDIFNRYRA